MNDSDCLEYDFPDLLEEQNISSNLNTAKNNNPKELPVAQCCKSILVAWENDLIGFFLSNNSNKISLIWNSMHQQPKESYNCIFCNKPLQFVK